MEQATNEQKLMSKANLALIVLCCTTLCQIHSGVCVEKGHDEWIFKLQMNISLLYQALSNVFWVSC